MPISRPIVEERRNADLEEVLRRSINEGLLLPRKSLEIEVSVPNGFSGPQSRPLTTKPEIVRLANSILSDEGVNVSAVDDTTRWDIFWAGEYAAALASIGTSSHSYRNFLPGRHLMYELLSDQVINLSPSQGSRVVDVGSGSGLSLLRLARQGMEPIGLDTSRVALKFAQYLSEHYEVKDRIHLARGDFHKLPLRSDSFDVAYNSGVFEHLQVQEARELINEMARVVKPGGYVLIAVPNADSPFYKNLQEKERTTYAKFKDKDYVRLPWETRRFRHDLKDLVQGASLRFIKGDGLQIAPSRPLKKGDLRPEDLEFFAEYLSDEPITKIGNKIAVWKRLEGNASPEQRMCYGWSIYVVGQKL